MYWWPGVRMTFPRKFRKGGGTHACCTEDGVSCGKSVVRMIWGDGGSFSCLVSFVLFKLRSFLVFVLRNLKFNCSLDRSGTGLDDSIQPQRM